jgi:hypothetical protein
MTLHKMMLAHPLTLSQSSSGLSFTSNAGHEMNRASPGKPKSSSKAHHPQKLIMLKCPFPMLPSTTGHEEALFQMSSTLCPFNLKDKLQQEDEQQSAAPTSQVAQAKHGTADVKDHDQGVGQNCRPGRRVEAGFAEQL